MPISFDEHAQIMRELGGSSSSSSPRASSSASNNYNSETIKIQHVVVLTMTDKLSEHWEKAIHLWVGKFLDLGRVMVPSIQMLTVSLSVYLLLKGGSHFIEACRAGQSRPTNTPSSSSTGRTTSSSK